MKWLEFIRGYISKLIICKSSVGIEASSKKYCNDLRISGVSGVNLSKAFFSFVNLCQTVFLVYWRICIFCVQLSSGEIAAFSLVQLEVIFNPTKSGNAQAEFEISFSDPLSPPVSTIMKPVSFCPVRRKMNLLKTAPSVPIFLSQ